VICTIAGEWGNWTCQACGLMWIYQNQLQKVKIMVLKWEVIEGYVKTAVIPVVALQLCCAHDSCEVA
jgi:hypothetical protein